MELALFIDSVLDFEDKCQHQYKIEPLDSFLDMETNINSSQILLNKLTRDQENIDFQIADNVNEIEVQKNWQYKLPDYSLPKKSKLFKELQHDLQLSYADLKM